MVLWLLLLLLPWLLGGGACWTPGDLHRLHLQGGVWDRGQGRRGQA